MRSGGESHLSLANTSVQKMIKMTPVTPCSSLVSWSVGEVWAAHGFMRCISSINTGSVFLSTQDRWPLSNIIIPIFLSLYYTFEIRWCASASHALRGCAAVRPMRSPASSHSL